MGENLIDTSIKDQDLRGFRFGQGDNIGNLSAISANLSSEISRNRDKYILPADGSVWNDYVQSHEPYVAGFGADDPNFVRSVCGHLFATPLTHGYAQGNVDYAGIKGSEASAKHVARIIIDKLCRLGEAVGVLGVYSPEHTPNRPQPPDLAVLLGQIEDVIGHDLSPPKVNGSLFGVYLRGHVYTERHFEAIYIAKRLLDLKVSSVIEIGGGAGYTAHYARRFGIKYYKIVDIPTVSMVQYIILAVEFGEEAVSFGASSGNLSLIPTYALNTLDWENADIVLNVDSLPEIPLVERIIYLKSAQKVGRLLSVNQESQSLYGIDRQPIIHNEVARYTKFTRMSRFPHWMRAGYVDEFFET